MKIKDMVRFEQFVGRSKSMQNIYKQIRQAAATDIPVLLLGETGTGKDLAAQAIHRLSKRKHHPYLPINLGALPSELVASELFGHEKGAFTGAVKQQIGIFEKGSDGTVFLDEIDSIEEKVQISLLRLIEQNKFSRLGGLTSIKSNARLITASNTDLKQVVQNGTFREDLYFRLDVFTIKIPPLNQRYSDIPLLVAEFIRRFNQSFNKHILKISPECTRLFEEYSWPGNVRELKNVIQRAILVCENAEIQTKDLPARFHKYTSSKPTITFKLGTTLEDMERKMIEHALSYCNNNRTEAAKLLGISRRAIYNKLNKYHL